MGESYDVMGIHAKRRWTEDAMRRIKNAATKAAYHARKQDARDLTRLLSSRNHISRTMYRGGEAYVDGIVEANIGRAREASDRYRNSWPLGQHLDALVRAYEHWQSRAGKGTRRDRM